MEKKTKSNVFIIHGLLQYVHIRMYFELTLLCIKGL